MDEERNRRPAAEEGAEEEAPDYTHELEMLDEFRGLMRRSGLALGVGIALGGWYLSRALGQWFLIGGVFLGLLVGGGFLIGGALGGRLFRKRFGERDKEDDE